MIVYPGQGVDAVRFGMTETDVITCLGDPNRRAVHGLDDVDTSHHSSLYYYDAMLELMFDADDDFRLGCIDCYHEDTILFGRRLIGMAKDEVVSFVGGASSSLLKYDEWQFTDWITLDDENLDLIFDLGHLECIGVNVRYFPDGDTPRWAWPNQIL